MSKLLNRPVKITLDPTGTPTDFTWKKRRFRITSIMEDWIETGEWWKGADEIHVYRVATQPPGIFEIHLTGHPGLRGKKQQTAAPPEPRQKENPLPVQGILYRVFD